MPEQEVPGRSRYLSRCCPHPPLRPCTLPHVLPELDLVIASRTFVRQGYRYIVVHKDFYPPYKAEQVEQLLTALYGIPKIYQRDNLLVFPLSLEGASE